MTIYFDKDLKTVSQKPAEHENNVSDLTHKIRRDLLAPLTKRPCFCHATFLDPPLVRS